MLIAEIKGAINKVLVDNTHIDLNSNDIKEGYKAPSFFVTFSRSKKIMQNNYMYKRELSVRIHYFPSSRSNYSIECYDMQDKLEDLFGKYLAVGKNIITIGETDTDIHEGVLLFDFDIEFFEMYQESLENDGILMQTLNIKTENK